MNMTDMENALLDLFRSGKSPEEVHALIGKKMADAALAVEKEKQEAQKKAAARAATKIDPHRAATIGQHAIDGALDETDVSDILYAYLSRTYHGDSEILKALCSPDLLKVVNTAVSQALTETEAVLNAMGLTWDDLSDENASSVMKAAEHKYKLDQLLRSTVSTPKPAFKAAPVPTTSASADDVLRRWLNENVHR